MCYVSSIASGQRRKGQGAPCIQTIPRWGCLCCTCCVLPSTAHRSCLVPAALHTSPGARAVGWDQGLPWDAAASLQCCRSDGETGQSCWILPGTEPQPWLGLSVAVALIRAVFDNYYYLIAGHCWLCKHSSER